MEDIYQTSLIDRYAARPDQLNNMCLAEFAANYTTCSGQDVPEDENTDALPLAKNDKVVDVKLLSSMVALDACTRGREKLSFAFTNSTSTGPR